jgi:hypothetical protein
MSTEPTAQLSPNNSMELFKFYEGAADKAKERSWSLTTWVLALNAAILAFSFDFFAKNARSPAFVVIEAASAIVGIALCAFIFYLLREAGSHISHYWTSSNRTAAAEPTLELFIGPLRRHKKRGRSATIALHSLPSVCVSSFYRLHSPSCILLREPY